MEVMGKFGSNRGQALLIVVITMIVVLTAGLSLASRTISNLKISKQSEDSQKAFQAATSGIEKYIQSGDSSNNTGQFSGASFSTNVQNVKGTSIVLNNGELVDQDRGIDVWLSDYPDYSNRMGSTGDTNISVCWATAEQKGNCNTGSGGNTTPALEILVLTGSPTAPILKKYVYDACGRGNGFTSPTILSDAVENTIKKPYAYKTSSVKKYIATKTFGKLFSSMTRAIVSNSFSASSLAQQIVASTIGAVKNIAAPQALAQSSSISLGANTIIGGNAGPSIVLSRPTGIVSGDVMLVNVAAGGTITAPSCGCWNLIQGASRNGLTFRTYYKVASASEPTSYTWTITSGNPFVGQWLNTKNVSTTSPIDVSAISAEFSPATNHSFPAVTTTVPGTYLIVFANGITSTIPYPASADWVVTSLNTNREYGNSYNLYSGTFYTPRSTAGTAGPYDVTTNIGMTGVMTTIALRPAVVPPTPTSATQPNLYVNSLKTVTGGDCSGAATSTFIAGQSLQICGTVGNNGTAAANGYSYASFRASTSQPTPTAYDYASGSLNAPVGYSSANNTLLNTTASTTGCSGSGSTYTCTAWVFIDRNNSFTESNESDNWASVTYTISTTSVPVLSASSNGNPFDNSITITNTITSAGTPATITSRGTCYGATANPTNCVATTGTSTGSFDQYIPNLSPNTLYHYRGFATNASGTGYSADRTFTTSPPPPTITSPTGSTVTAGTRNIQWNSPAGATGYYLRINDLSTPWNPGVDPAACDGASTTSPTEGNVCKYLAQNPAGNTYSYNFQNGHTYTIWIHSANASYTYSNSTNITVTTGPGVPTPTPVTTYSSTTLDCKYRSNPITLTNSSPGLIMKIIPLYNSTKIALTSSNDLAPFPTQGKVIESTGSSGDTQRKIVYFESYPQIPNELFSYGILSQ